MVEKLYQDEDVIKMRQLVKKLRKKLRLSQHELALKLHITAIAVSKWERGVSRMSKKNQAKIIRLANKAGIGG